MRGFSSVTIFMLAINEVETLSDSVQIIIDTCNHEDIEQIILLLADRATPECLETANKLQNNTKEFPVVVIQQKTPSIPKAFFEGFSNCKGSHFIIMSSDGETDPRIVKDFIAKSKEFPESVISASRWLSNNNFKDYGKINKFLNFVFQRVVNILYKTEMTDATFVYYSFPNEVIRRMLIKETDFNSSLELVLKSIRLGVDFIEIPTVWVRRKEGKSHNSYLKKLLYLKPLLKVFFMNKKDVLDEKRDNKKH